MRVDTISFNELTRFQKGFLYENRITQLLSNHNFTFNSNPTTFQEWKRNIGNGADIKLELNNKRIEIECKFLDSTAYPSYILRDYIPRFSNADVRIVVTNNKWNISRSARQLLVDNNIRVYNTYELLYYLIKLNKSNLNDQLEPGLLDYSVHVEEYREYYYPTIEEELIQYFTCLLLKNKRRLYI